MNTIPAVPRVEIHKHPGTLLVPIVPPNDFHKDGEISIRAQQLMRQPVEEADIRKSHVPCVVSAEPGHPRRKDRDGTDEP
jgi:hypothetical protein